MNETRLGKWMMLSLLLLLAPRSNAQINPDWTTPIAQFRIAGNLYYVGGKDLATYLIVTPQREQAFEKELKRQQN